MKKVKMLTVVPANLAATLKERKRIKDYNTLPQLDSGILNLIREYMTEHVGYSNLPIACLSCFGDIKTVNGEELLSKLPINHKNSVLFQLEMPEDMIVSIDFGELLAVSQEMEGLQDAFAAEFDFIKERLFENLVLGVDDSLQDPISFIPFLDVERCKFYARFDPNFDAAGMDLPGLERINIRELTSFMN